ncbi:MFS general substrate transporter [Dacryopinax primogenitus]|uniref:MFS general substrate transporter n=1 Tax=Dacryopinax primogenitus (strain DJM 731) TaxID=1858805 RepID=M5GAT7_DACPD|nr:MFS general substrate transporter [Dacryopinax primogenitus]EJU01043.1 MFS general substrate transporter [Dacryopinax primogenitus]
MSMCTFGYINAYGVYQAYYVQTLLPSYSPSAISCIGSLQTCLLFLCGLVTGRLFDAGYFRPMMIGGGVLVVGCIFAQSAVQVDGYYQVFLSQAIGQGVGLGIVYLPSLAVLGQHFQKHRSTATGVAVAGSSFGGIVFPILLNNVFQSRGFQWSVRAMGFFQLGAMIIANLLMSTNYNPYQKAMKPPSPLKLLRDIPCRCGGWNVDNRSRTLLHLFVTVLGVLCKYLRQASVFYIQLYAETVGISDTVAFYTLAIINAVSIFGRTLPNLLADKFGPLTVLIPCSVIAGTLVFTLLGVKNVAGLVIVCIMYSFWSGAYVSLAGPMFASMADNLSEIGLRMGLAFVFLGFSALIGTPIDGALLGEEGPSTLGGKLFFLAGQRKVTMLAGCGLLVVGWSLLRKKNKRWV